MRGPEMIPEENLINLNPILNYGRGPKSNKQAA